MIPNEAGLRRVERGAFVVALASLAAAAWIWASHPAAFHRGYLLAFQFWIGPALGALALLLLHGLVGGDWGRVLRGPLAAAAATIPIMAVLFVPLLFGLRFLYPWAATGAEADEILLHKRPYLNPGFFAGRAVAVLVLWSVMAVALGALLHRLHAGRTSSESSGVRIFLGAGLILFVLTASFASIDWILSLEPKWHSAGFGLIQIAGYGLSGLALGIIGARLLAPPSHDPAPSVRDVGNLLLALLMIWSYLAFSQYLVIWSANIPEEAAWYLHRAEGGWRIAGYSLVLFHFALPFLLLLSARAKKDLRVLSGVAIGLLAMRAVETHWLIVPSFSPEGFSVGAADAAAFLGIGGLWIGLWLRRFRRSAARLSAWPLLEEVRHA